MPDIVASLTHHGLGRLPDGRLVPRVLPGEEVEVQADGTARILRPSADRVAAPCRHFRSCGGCAVQHMRDDAVAAWKAGIVTGALAGQGISGEIASVHTSPPQSRRRATFHGRKTKGGAIVGFHARASDTIVEVPDCQLVTPRLRALIPALGSLTAVAGSRTTEVALTVTDSLTGPEVVAATDKPLDAALRQSLSGWADRHGIARLVWGDEVALQREPPRVVLGPGAVSPPPGAFLQATEDGQATLQRLVLDAVRSAGRVADLFAGCGTFALPLSREADVHAVESEAAMLAALDAGWRAVGGLHRITTEARDLFRRPLLPDELRRFDAVVIDPPRAGAEAQVEQIAAARVPVVAMVSCNPASFARDARILLSAGFRMGPITVIDQFRWSAHVELASRFTMS